MRQIFDIHGGIHPPERKDMSNPGWVRDCDMPSKLILPVTQHIGAPARPVVEVATLFSGANDCRGTGAGQRTRPCAELGDSDSY